MNIQSTYSDHASVLVTVDDRVYAPYNFEHKFDTSGSEQTNVSQKHAESTPHLLTAKSRRGAVSPASREDMLAMKTAQLVSERVAREGRVTLSHLGREFALDAFVRQTARWVASLTVPTLQPLAPARRVQVAARAVDPTDYDEKLDLILDGVGRVLATYCHYLPDTRWMPLLNVMSGISDACVLGWRSPDGAVVLDLLDTLGPARAPDDHGDEIADVLRVGRHQFGPDLTAVRYLPAFTMSQARLYYPGGYWEPYLLAAPVPALRLAA